jgi:cell division septal protein FtsQ
MTTEQAHESIPAPKPPKKKRWLFVLVGLLIVLLVGILAGIYLSQPGPSASCSLRDDAV